MFRVFLVKSRRYRHIHFAAGRIAVEVWVCRQAVMNLIDLQWERLKDFLPGKECVGRTATDNRLFVNGVLWVSRGGAIRYDLPERYASTKA
jgi:hypothetical protein